MNKSSIKVDVMPWIIWSIAVLFYTYEFVHRISPNVMTAQLMEDFQIYATALGSLSAYYYYAYAACQIPMGILADRYPITRILLFSCFITTFGSYLITIADTLWVAQLARILLGVGSSSVFVCCLKLGEMLLKPKDFPIIVGITNFSGTLGAFLGGAPLAYFVSTTSWRVSLFWMSIIGTLLFFIMLFIYRHRYIVKYQEEQSNLSSMNHAKNHSQPISIKASIKNVIGSWQTWVIAFFGALLVAPIGGFTELWCTPFIEKTFEVSHESAAFATSLTFAGIALGGPCIGFLAARTLQIKALMFSFTSLALLFLGLIIYTPLTFTLCKIYLLLFGFCTSNMLLCFSLVRSYHPKCMGIALSFTNTLVMLLGAAFQPIVGHLLDKQSKDQLLSYDYQSAFVLLPLCLCLALIVIYFIKIPKESIYYKGN